LAVGAEVLRNKHSQGKGAALQLGWRHAYSRGFEWALAMDGDGQHDPNDMTTFTSSAEKTSAALIVGNRMTEASRMPIIRRFVNRWMSRQISRFTGTDLPDSQCGFRLINLAIWAQLSITAKHFEIESDVLLSFLADGRTVVFVPIKTVYQSEKSKINIFSDTVRWFRWWRKARRSYLRMRQTAADAKFGGLPQGISNSPG
jgi:glycosyltransferase involved in cell wall biosynthesis